MDTNNGNEPVKNKHSERQAAGYFIEDHVKSMYYDDIPDNTYIGSFDAIAYDGTPVQIKGKKIKKPTVRTALEMGSLYRLHKDDDFILDVTFYNKKSNGECNAHTNIVYHVSAEKWNAAIPDDMNTMFAHERVFGGISNDKSDDDKWKKRRKKITKEYKDKHPDSPFTPLFKRDSKKQSRMQVSIRLKALETMCDKIEHRDDDYSWR